MHSLKGSEHKRFEERTAMNTRTEHRTARAASKRAATWLVTLAGALALATTGVAQKGGKPDGGGGGGSVPGNPAIAYIGDIPEGGGRGSLKVMDADGRNPRVVLQQSGTKDINFPTWHPDGQRIIFTYAPNSRGGAGIYRINLDGSELTAIVSPPKAWFHSYKQCDVSPRPGVNGKYRIAFTDDSSFASVSNPGSSIWIVNEDGSGRIPIAPHWAFSPSWSPDGKHVAYIRIFDDSSGQRFFSVHLVTLAEAPGGTVEAISDVVLLDLEGFDLLRQISFSRTQNTIYLSTPYGLWALDLDDEMTLIGAEPIGEPWEYACGVGRLSASPDDSTIAFQFSWCGSSPAIWIVNSDGSNDPELIANNAREPSFKK
jgi:hypothetical protein